MSYLYVCLPSLFARLFIMDLLSYITFFELAFKILHPAVWTWAVPLSRSILFMNQQSFKCSTSLWSLRDTYTDARRVLPAIESRGEYSACNLPSRKSSVFFTWFPWNSIILNSIQFFNSIQLSWFDIFPMFVFFKYSFLCTYMSNDLYRWLKL